MTTLALDEIRKLSVAERIQLAQDIWDSLAAEEGAVSLTDAQREELDHRLAAHVQAPEAGLPWEQVKARLLKSE